MRESSIKYQVPQTGWWAKYKNAFILLRIPFSIYLMPVYWFALSVTPQVPVTEAIIVFLIIHVLVYPASNGYNSYQDKDEGSIGGLKQPPKVTKELLHLVIIFDLQAILCGLFISVPFAVMVTLYLFVSKAYSYKGIRLKKFPWLSTMVVTIFQGAFTFAMVQVGIGLTLMEVLAFPNFLYAAVSTLFLCGSYPLTQIYQHAEDSARGDKTLSLLLGTKGTFLFAGFSLAAGTALLLYLYFEADQPYHILIFLVCTSPVLFFFSTWVWQALKDTKAVNFENTMRMNKISSICISTAFILTTLLF